MFKDARSMSATFSRKKFPEQIAEALNRFFAVI